MGSSSPFLVMMLSMWVLISCSEAKEYVVGGSTKSWKFPLSKPDSLSHWANSHQFKMGDALIFKYDERSESVHQVNQTDYERCNTAGKEHVVFKDGNTKVMLTDYGFKHFISGNQSHCQMGLKLEVNVLLMSNNTKKKLDSPSPSPSPSPSSPSPSPLANNQGVTPSSGAGIFMMCLGLMAMLLV